MQDKETKAYWKERFDEKRFFLCMTKRAWVILAAALAGALFAGGLYLMVRLLTQGPVQYQAQVLYAIRYNVQEEDETLKAFINEYNAHTWGDMMRSDKVMVHVMALLPDMDRAEVEAAVSTSIASDPEFLSAQFTADSPETADRMAEAFNTAMRLFGETLTERGLTAIEAWKTTEAQEIRPENRVKNAAFLGLVLGGAAGCIALMAWYVLDDSVRTHQDLDGVDMGYFSDKMRGKNLASCFWGYRTDRADTVWDQELSANIAYAAQTKAFREIDLHSALNAQTDYELLREAPVVLYLKWSKVSRRLLLHAVSQLARQDVEVAGIVITDTDSRFLALYYGKKKAGILADDREELV